MKTYNQFLTENYANGEFNTDLPIGFRFSVDFTDATQENLYEFGKEMKKYFVFEKYGMLTRPTHDPKPWAWSFEISIGSKGVELEYWPIASPTKSKFFDTESGVKFMQNLVPIDDFVSVGFKGVKNFIRMKTDMNKFNL